MEGGTMQAGRAVAVLAGAATLLVLGLGPAYPQTTENGLRVRAVHPGSVEAKPLTAVTLVFAVANGTGKAHDFSPRLEVPEEWTPVIEDTAFRLDAGGESIRLISLAVPARAPMGSYRVGYALGAADDPSISARVEAEVAVVLEAGLAVEAEEARQLVVAGDRCRASFLVTSRSNAALDVDLQVVSNDPGVAPDARTVRLEAGESRSVGITLATDPRLSQKLSQQVQLTAVARIPGDGRVGASAMTEFEIIPRVSGVKDYFYRLPAEVGFSAIGAGGARGYGQFNVSGAGALDSEDLHRLDFTFRGPGRSVGRDLTYPFGLRPDEYRASYESPGLNILAGDGTYSLTRLTETGNYGRGLDVEAAFGQWAVKGYLERAFVQNGTGDEKAFQLGWGPGKDTRFDLSLMSRQDPGSPTVSRVVSLRSGLVRRLFHLDVECSTDLSAGPGFRPAGSALWVDGGQAYKKWRSEFNVIRSGARYSGYFRDLAYDSVEASYEGSERWAASASYRDQKTHTAIGPYILPFSDETFQAGAHYRALRCLVVSVDERIHDRRDLSPEAAYDYRDSTLRLGTFFYAGAFGLQNFVDIGRTLNRLTRESERLTEYTVSANTLALGRISLAAYLHYRDQNESFTGERLRRLDVNFSTGLQWRGIDLNAFYRTAVLQDLYQNALSRQNFSDPAFLLNNCDTFGVDLRYRFRNGHGLSLRIQKVISPFWDGHPRRALVSLLSYSVPVGVPVSRKTTVGLLRGRVYDAEGGGQGVPGVIVRANDMATVTGPKGEYVFNSLAPGAYVLTLDDRRTGSGKVAVERMPLTVVVEGGGKLDRPIGLTTGASVGGRAVIYDAASSGWGPLVRKEPRAQAGPADAAPSPNGSGDTTASQLVERAPLCGTTVELRGEGDVFEQVTDKDGRFLFEGLRPGSYTLRVLDDNLPESHVFERDTFELTLKPGDKQEVTVKVVPVVRTIELIDGGEVRIKKKREPEH